MPVPQANVIGVTRSGLQESQANRRDQLLVNLGNAFLQNRNLEEQKRQFDIEKEIDIVKQIVLNQHNNDWSRFVKGEDAEGNPLPEGNPLARQFFKTLYGSDGDLIFNQVLQTIGQTGEQQVQQAMDSALGRSAPAPSGQDVPPATPEVMSQLASFSQEEQKNTQEQRAPQGQGQRQNIDPYANAILTSPVFTQNPINRGATRTIPPPAEERSAEEMALTGRGTEDAGEGFKALLNKFLNLEGIKGSFQVGEVAKPKSEPKGKSATMRSSAATSTAAQPPKAAFGKRSTLPDVFAYANEQDKADLAKIFEDTGKLPQDMDQLRIIQKNLRAYEEVQDTANTISNPASATPEKITKAAETLSSQPQAFIGAYGKGKVDDFISTATKNNVDSTSKGAEYDSAMGSLDKVIQSGSTKGLPAKDKRFINSELNNLVKESRIAEKSPDRDELSRSINNTMALSKERTQNILRELELPIEDMSASLQANLPEGFRRSRQFAEAKYQFRAQQGLAEKIAAADIGIKQFQLEMLRKTSTGEGADYTAALEIAKKISEEFRENMWKKAKSDPAVYNKLYTQALKDSTQFKNAEEVMMRIASATSGLSLVELQNVLKSGFWFMAKEELIKSIGLGAGMGINPVGSTVQGETPQQSPDKATELARKYTVTY